MQKLTLVLQWENRNLFKLVEKGDPNATPPVADINIIELHENATINEVFPGVQAACIAYFGKKMQEIGADMRVV